MKTVETALQNHLNTEKNFISCDLFELVLAIAGGKRTLSERSGFKDLAIFKNGVTL